MTTERRGSVTRRSVRAGAGAAAYATCEGDGLELTAFMASPSGDEAFRCTIEGPANDPRGLAAEAFRQLAGQGADGLVERG